MSLWIIYAVCRINRFNENKSTWNTNRIQLLCVSCTLRIISVESVLAFSTFASIKRVALLHFLYQKISILRWIISVELQPPTEPLRRMSMKFTSNRKLTQFLSPMRCQTEKWNFLFCIKQSSIKEFSLNLLITCKIFFFAKYSSLNRLSRFQSCIHFTYSCFRFIKHTQTASLYLHCTKSWIKPHFVLAYKLNRISPVIRYAAR